MSRVAMRRVAGVAIVALLALALPGWPGAQPRDTPEARRAAALTYLAAVPTASMVDDMINAIAQQVPLERREEFVRLMRKIMSIDKLNALTLEGVVKHFTVGEIEALTIFYGSAEGQAIMKKFGGYMGDLMPAVQAEMFRALQEVRAEMRI